MVIISIKDYIKRSGETQSKPVSDFENEYQNEQVTNILMVILILKMMMYIIKNKDESDSEELYDNKDNNETQATRNISEGENDNEPANTHNIQQ